MPSGRTWLDGEEVNGCFRQLLPNAFDKGFKILSNFARRFARGDVVVTRVKNNLRRTIRNNDFVDILDDIGDVRAAEATIDSLEFWKIRSEVRPQSNARAS